MQPTLLQLLTVLRAAHQVNPAAIIRHGFTNPHSYRGYYEELAFEPDVNIPVGTLLKTAESAVGNIYGGWKGGEYIMTLTTSVNRAEQGRTHDDDEFGGMAPTLAELAYVIASPHRPRPALGQREDA